MFQHTRGNKSHGQASSVFPLVFAVLGIVEGFGYTLWCKAYPIAIGLVIAGYLAYPEFKKKFKEMLE